MRMYRRDKVNSGAKPKGHSGEINRTLKRVRHIRPLRSLHRSSFVGGAPDMNSSLKGRQIGLFLRVRYSPTRAPANQLLGSLGLRDGYPIFSAARVFVNHVAWHQFLTGWGRHVRSFRRGDVRTSRSVYQNPENTLRVGIAAVQRIFVFRFRVVQKQTRNWVALNTRFPKECARKLSFSSITFALRRISKVRHEFRPLHLFRRTNQTRSSSDPSGLLHTRWCDDSIEW